MHEDLLNIVHHIYQKEEISRVDIAQLVGAFRNQALDFHDVLKKNKKVKMRCRTCFVVHGS